MALEVPTIPEASLSQTHRQMLNRARAACRVQASRRALPHIWGQGGMPPPLHYQMPGIAAKLAPAGGEGPSCIAEQSMARAGIAAVEPSADPADDVPVLHASIYEELRTRLITGKIVPGLGLSTRGLAAELGVSQMPVRDALSRLAAEGAVEIRSKRKIMVPPMTPERFDDLLHCRMLLEPDAAARALPNLDPIRIRHLTEIDAGMDLALASGNALAYMEGNFAFHFTIYRAGAAATQTRLIETLWLQFGPYMRVVHGRFGTANLVDQHRLALAAIAARDADALRHAIAGDIADGMGLIGRTHWA